jgi:hypothetical protein
MKNIGFNECLGTDDFKYIEPVNNNESVIENT